MDGDTSDWDIISKEVPETPMWETLLGAALGGSPLVARPFKFTVRQRSTGYVKTLLAWNERELPERIAKGAFHFERVVSEDAAELILMGLRGNGEARALAFDHVEFIFRQRLQRGDIGPQELFTNLQDFLRPAGEDAVQEFTRRCSPLLPPNSA